MKRTLISLNHALLLTMLLLIGQSAALWHQTHSEQHPAGELCSYCLQASDLSTPALSGSSPQAPYIPLSHNVLSTAETATIAATTATHQARAPPRFS
ncbi:hypothetical protein [Thalassolituus hydrocarboniclasticus]|uniref:DUF2946 domain-containing protein n=1 Tax=Thalassolituus hydrocarboniclasticus TaxID=2742796 RepID=A0ABY6A7S4_9GAMM|nr:hypothetical protein [Thalassolituus hydrocarboniclasticus]UXD86962.1 hypothetical protein HUF19_05675 [Thalassolituus hydrocarboniclasticus]